MCARPSASRRWPDKHSVFIRLLAAGTRLPSWVKAGYEEYAGRIGPEVRLELVEIAVAHRGRNADLARLRTEEGRRMLAGISPRMYVAALDPGGNPLWSQRFGNNTSQCATAIAGDSAGKERLEGGEVLPQRGGEITDRGARRQSPIGRKASGRPFPRPDGSRHA